MSKIFNRARQIQQKSPREVFRSENGAIDLSSIMVGIIVIGLMGGVIAATVFAVIPWSQDNAAKQQLDSIVVAESAYMGLSSTNPPSLPAGLEANSFGKSSELETAGLLKAGPKYCVSTMNTGPKSYEAFSMSSSGNIWTATDKATKPIIFTGTLPADCEFITDGVAAPNPTPTPTTPPAPVYTSVRYLTFEGSNNTEVSSYFSIASADYITNSTSDGIVGSRALFAQTSSSGNVNGNPTRITYRPNSSLIIGQKYRITFLTKITSSTTNVVANYSSSTSVLTSASGKNTVTLEFVPTVTNPAITITATGPGQYNRPLLILDEFKLDRVD